MRNSPGLHAGGHSSAHGLVRCCLQQASFLIFFAVACVLYVGGGAGYAVKVQGKTYAQDGKRSDRLLTTFLSTCRLAFLGTAASCW